VASHSIAADEIGVHNVALTANIVETFTFADDVPALVIATDGAAAIYYTLDANAPAPTVGGKYAHVMLAALGYYDDLEPPTAGGTVVRMISTGTPVVSVCRDQ
jgi:hypothetical protein